MLVIHIISTEDTSNFSNIYANLDATVLINPTHIKARRYIAKETGPIILIGHGTEQGLLNHNLNGYIIDSSCVDILKNKTVIGIWCFAGNFADRHGLTGFFTSNFISNVEELTECGFETFEDCENIIVKENISFADRVNQMLRDATPLNEWIDNLQKNISDYRFVGYNYEALYVNE